MTERDSSLLPTMNLVDRAVRERHEEQVAVRPGLDVGDDAEVPAEQQALALDDGPGVCRGVGRRRLVEVVGDPVLQPGIIHPDLPAVAGQVEAPQEATFEERPGGTHEEVAVVLRTYPGAVHEANGRRGHLKLPAELWVAVVCARQHHHPPQRLLGRVGDVRRWPPRLLKVAAEHRRLDLFELIDPREWPHDLDPAAVHPRLDQVQLGKRVVAVLLQPQVAGLRVEVEAEAVAVAVGEQLCGCWR